MKSFETVEIYGTNNTVPTNFIFYENLVLWLWVFGLFRVTGFSIFGVFTVTVIKAQKIFFPTFAGWRVEIHRTI